MILFEKKYIFSFVCLNFSFDDFDFLVCLETGEVKALGDNIHMYRPTDLNISKVENVRIKIFKIVSNRY